MVTPRHGKLFAFVFTVFPFVVQAEALITFFTALVPFGFACRLQNPQVSGDGYLSGVEIREKIAIKRNGKKNYFMNRTMRGRVGRDGELITTWIRPAFHYTLHKSR